MRKKRIKKCESCTPALHKVNQCMTCDQEIIMKNKVAQVMHEFKEHTLHARSKKGPLVHSRQQAVAIALHQGRKAAGILPQNKKK